MKNLNKYAFINAMMLAGAIGFTACSSDNDPIEEQRNGNEEVVKTQFAINIPYAGKGNTRMSDEIVQGQNPAEFRGMQNIRLMPVMLTGDNITGVPDDDVTSTVNGSTIILANIAKKGDLSTSNAKYKVYNNVGIPVGTNAFLFYGEALSESNADETKKNAINGKLITTPDFSTTINDNYSLNNITFRLQPFVEDDNTSIKDAETALVEILNNIANAEGWAASTDETIKGLYNQFTSLQAGSANSILLMIQELYNKVNDITDNNIKTAINTQITNKFTVTGNAPNATLAYVNTSYNKYPTNLGLPCGAVRVQWSENKFQYVHPQGGQNPFNVTNLSAYTYPSALFYMANTLIKTSTSTQSTNYGSKEWTGDDGILSLYTNGGVITNGTRSVALENPINYAVSRFDVKAQFSTSTPLDKAHKTVTVPEGGFDLTGVLIGGQKAVNWNFLPTSKATEENTIFDTELITKKISTTDNGIQNKTLVLASAANTNVHFALELKNNSNTAFQGVDGTVHANATFYLIGELKYTDANPSVFQKDYYTTATVTINGLTNAYNCVPDLRTPKLELGLSVNLEWKEGINHDVTIE